MTADEMIIAGYIMNTINSSNYLYTNVWYWLGSPSHFNTSRNDARGFGIGSINYPNSRYNIDTYGSVRPVISLIPNISSTGNGTWNNPYIIN